MYISSKDYKTMYKNLKNEFEAYQTEVKKRNSDAWKTAEALRANLITTTHQNTFAKYKNIYAGREVVVMATGPSLSYYEPIKDAIHIGMNRAYQQDKVKLDYIFCQDGTATAEYIDEIDNLEDTIKFYGVNWLHEAYREGVRIPDYHLAAKNAYRYYYWNPPSRVISPDISMCPVFCKNSVSYCAIHFALYTHPKTIYIVGCDGTLEPHFNGSQRDEVYLKIAKESTARTNDNYPVLKEFADTYYPDTELIMVNPVAVKGVFKDIYTKSYLEKDTTSKEEEQTCVK